MKALTGNQMRQLDSLTISDYGVPGEVLMERAGAGVAQTVDDLARMSGFGPVPIWLVAGHGNNGGDVFCAARILAEMEHRVTVWLAGDRRRVKGEALKHLERMRAAGVRLTDLSRPYEWEDLLATMDCAGGITVDGVLGIGVTGPARGVAAAAIDFINALGERGPVVAVDIPSGLDADTGVASGDVVKADITLTIGFPKRGLLAPEALEYVGSVEVIDIGIPEELSQPIDSDLELVAAADVRRLMPARRRTSHKGVHGHVLVIAGAPGYMGAAALAARAAARSGVGLVTTLVPPCAVPIVGSIVPEAMTHCGTSNAVGSLSGTALSDWGQDLNKFDAIVVGPGMTACADTAALVKSLVADYSGALLLDADALNVLADDIALLRARQKPFVATPHPGEMSRLLNMSVAEVQGDRFAAARAGVERWGGVTVLKGAGTLVAEAGRALQVNLSGNPGMARGGMGDILAGLLGGLLAQGLPPFDAARVAVYLHGRAGDRVAWSSSRAGMVAGDVVESLAHVAAELLPR